MRSGGKVVKNAAGFLLHQALVGSCGTLGIVAELTFKVFPARRSARHGTGGRRRPRVGDCRSMATVQRARFDLEALDLEPPGTVWLRLGGFREALATRVAALRQAIGGPTRDPFGETMTPRVAGCAGVRVGSAGHVPRARADRVADAASAGRGDGTLRCGAAICRGRQPGARSHGATRWTRSPTCCAGMDLIGQVLLGPPGRRFIGAVSPNAFEERLRQVMDPDARFS